MFFKKKKYVYHYCTVRQEGNGMTYTNGLLLSLVQYDTTNYKAVREVLEELVGTNDFAIINLSLIGRE